MTDLLTLHDLTKTFVATTVLKQVSFSIRKGEILGLLGENGAGKSTLIKIVSGAHQASSGHMEWDGQPYAPANPLEPRSKGIITIYQEFNLVGTLSVAENIFLGRQPRGPGGVVDWPAMARAARVVMERVGLNVPPDTLVGRLSVGQQQMVEIARALTMEARLIIMDEPTAALSLSETAMLIKVMEKLRTEGVSILFVTHRLEEVMQICDRVVVLRDGALVAEREAPHFSIDMIIELMVGRQGSGLFQHVQRPPVPAGTPPILRVSGLSTRKTSRADQRTPLKDVSLELYPGEILGIAGLVGAGRTELARAIFGADPITSGQIELRGKPVQIRSPGDAIRLGIGLVNEDRKQQGLFLLQSNRSNFSVATLKDMLRWGFVVDRKREAEAFDTYSDMLNVRMTGPEQKISALSGGNQQKVILARWLALKPAILIVDEPTRGIDVGAKSEVHALLRQLADSGIAVIAITSDLPEVLALSDRIITMTEGHVSGCVPGDGASEEQLMALMAPISRNRKTSTAGELA